MGLGCVVFSLLENESKAKLQLTHPGRRTRRIIALDVGDLAGRAATVDAGIALVAVEAQNWMVKDVVGIKAELRFVALRDVKRL